MATVEEKGKKGYEVYQPEQDNIYGLKSVPLPPELLQQIFWFLPRDVATLNLVCKEWRVHLSSMYLDLTRVQWPHLFEKLDPSTPWALYYTKKMIIESNLRDCKFTTHCLKAPAEAHYNSEIYHLSHRRIALLRLCPTLIPVFPFFFPRQLDIINLETGKILQAIEIPNQFHIKDNILYVDADDKIHMYDIDTGLCKGYFEGHIGQIVQLYVDRFHTLFALTKEPKGLFSWNLETAEFHKYKGNGSLEPKMRVFEGDKKTILLKRVIKGHHHHLSFAVSLADKESKSISMQGYDSHNVVRQILHEGLEIEARETGWMFFVGEVSTDTFKDDDHNIRFVITEPNHFITLTKLENGNEIHVQFWDIEKKEKVRDVEVNDPEGLLARATLYEMFRPSEDCILIVGNVREELYEFIAVVNLSTGTLIERKLRENALTLPSSDEVTFTHFDNQVVTFIASKATYEMPNRELVIRVVKFDGKDDAKMPSDRTLEMGNSVDLDSFKKGTLTTSAIAFETFKEHVNQTSPSIVKYTNEGYGICKGLLKVLSYGFAIGAALLSLVMMGVQFFYHRLAEPRLKNLIGRQK